MRSSLHAYTKSLKTGINTRIFIILSLHKAYIKPTLSLHKTSKKYLFNAPKVAFQGAKSGFMPCNNLLLNTRAIINLNTCRKIL